MLGSHVSSTLLQLTSAHRLTYHFQGSPSEHMFQWPCFTVNKQVASLISKTKNGTVDYTQWDRVTMPIPIFGSRLTQGFGGSICCISKRRSWTPARAKSDDSDGIRSSTEESVLDEQSLQRDLQVAIKAEDYVRAAQIRDSLRLLHEDSKTSVLAVNARFYNAFRNGDLAAMQILWSKGGNVYCVHPGAGGISGYDLVMQSWEVVCGADYDFPIDIELKNVEVHVRGDVGYVTCEEFVRAKGNNWGKQVASNVFERVGGQWFICIHHASYIDL